MKSEAPVEVVKQVAQLTPAESKLLTECEATVQRNLHSFLEFGQALATIRDKELYRQTHGTFAHYVQDKFEMSVRRAQQIVQSAAVVRRIVDAKLISHLPETENQVRHLVTLPEEKQAKAWSEAVKEAKGGKVTARHVARVLHLFRDRPARTRQARRPRIRFTYLDQCEVPQGMTAEDTLQFNRFLKIWRNCSSEVRSGLSTYIQKAKESNDKHSLWSPNPSKEKNL